MSANQNYLRTQKKKDDIPYIRSGREIFRPFSTVFLLLLFIGHVAVSEMSAQEDSRSDIFE